MQMVKIRLPGNSLKIAAADKQVMRKLAAFKLGVGFTIAENIIIYYLVKEQWTSVGFQVIP